MTEPLNPKSTHIPECAGGAETVTGSLVVQTGLRHIQSVVASFGQALGLAAEVAVTAEIDATVPGRITLRTYDAGGVAGTNPCKVQWQALGR